jgi:ankyrin repeat protein
VAELLLELGGELDIRDTRKQTALHRIIDRVDDATIDAVQFLLEHGADVNAQRDDLCTPLHQALNAGELEVARMLLDHQADVNLRNEDGRTLLHLLSRWEAPEDIDDGSDLVKLLLKRGANVNEKDKYNLTPLHLASYYKRLKIVQVLLDHGASTDLENDHGDTPFQIAIRGCGNSQGDGVAVAQLLLEHSVEAYAQDKYHLSTSGYIFGKDFVFLLRNRDNFKKENSGTHAFRLWMEGEIHVREHSH